MFYLSIKSVAEDQPCLSISFGVVLKGRKIMPIRPFFLEKGQKPFLSRKNVSHQGV